MIGTNGNLKAVALVMIPRARELVAQRAEGEREFQNLPGILKGAD